MKDVFLWLAGILLLATCSLAPTAETTSATESDSDVTVATTPYYTFTPVTGAKATGFIFYPGANVDPAAYAPMAKRIAKAKYTAVIVKMPLNLAIFNVGAASAVMAEHPEIAKWTISGHSLGGAMACSYAKSNPGKIVGLILLAAYPGDSDSLSATEIATLSLYATYDGLSTPVKIENSKKNLPSNAKYVEIAGGNHAQFGYYGTQNGDGTATISRDQQQNIAVSNIIAFLSNI